MPPIRQSSFASGELAPQLYGRTVSRVYAEGLRRLRDFFVGPAGEAVSRPGTLHKGVVKNAADQVRLVPFIYSDSQSYFIEFGPSYVRFWSGGAQVLSGGVPLELASPYAAVDLPYLQWAQVGDVLRLSCKGHAPYELERLSATSWTLAAVDFSRPDPTCSPVYSAALFSPDTNHPARPWRWVVTEVRRDDRGVLWESKSTPVLSTLQSTWASGTTYAANDYVKDVNGRLYRSLQSSNTGNALTDTAWWAEDSVPLAPDMPMTVWIGSSYVDLSTDPNFISYRVYRGRDDVYGWVGDTKASSFVDVGDEPDFALAPPQGLNPLEVHAADGTLARTETPNACTFFEDRCILGGTTERPGTLFGSAVDDFANFDRRLVLADDEAVQFTLASRRREEIRSMVGLDKLLVGTNGSIWSVGGSGGPLTPTSVEARVCSELGVAWLAPLVVGGVACWVRQMGAGVLGVAYDYQTRSYVAQDVSRRSRHFFDGFTVVDWAYAEQPWSLVWAVRNDGALLCFSYDAAEGVQAWSQCNLAGMNAVVESVCAVPETTEYAVYLAVRRTVNGATVRYIERLATRLISDITTAVCVDAAVTQTLSPASTAVSGLDHLEGEQVYGLADGAVVGPLTVSGGAVTLAAAATTVVLGLRYQPELELLDVAQERGVMKEVSEVLVEVQASRGLWTGQDSDHLVEWDQRSVSDGYSPPSAYTGLVRVPVQGSWGTGGRAFLRQVDPLPLTVLGVTRELEVGG